MDDVQKYNYFTVEDIRNKYTNLSYVHKEHFLKR
jgi:hypothetical protein